MAVASGRAGGAMALPIFRDGNDIHTVFLRKRATSLPVEKRATSLVKLLLVVQTRQMCLFRQIRVMRCDANFIDFPGVANRRAKFEDGYIYSCLRLSSRSDLPELPSSPHQPSSFTFPKRCFGNKVVVQRSCQRSWFERLPFLHYDEGKDVVFCHTCVTGFRKGKMKSSKEE